MKFATVAAKMNSPQACSTNRPNASLVGQDVKPHGLRDPQKPSLKITRMSFSEMLSGMLCAPTRSYSSSAQSCEIPPGPSNRPTGYEKLDGRDAVSELG